MRIRMAVIGAAAAAGALALSSCGGSKSAETTTTVSTTTTAPSTTTTAPLTGQALLGSLVVAQADAPSGYTVELMPEGDQVVNNVSLDLCNAVFPSEALRTDRRQVVLHQGDTDVLSTEGVLYRDAAAAGQAAGELVEAERSCPNKFLPGTVEGEPPTKTTFRAAPDGAWPTAAGVRRLAFDFDVADQQGHKQHGMAVYLFRGRAMVAVYFSDPDTPLPAVGGQTSVQGVVTLLQSRLAAASAGAIGA